MWFLLPLPENQGRGQWCPRMLKEVPFKGRLSGKGPYLALSAQSQPDPGWQNGSRPNYKHHLGEPVGSSCF